MITTSNIQEKVMSWLYYKAPDLDNVMRLYIHEDLDYLMITVHSWPPTITDSKMWECQNVRVDIARNNTFEFLANLDIQKYVTIWLNERAASMPTIEEIFKSN